MGTDKRSLSFTDPTQDPDVVDPVRNDDDEEDDSKENAEGRRFPVGFVSGYVMGEVHPGENVVLVREPNNSDDSNAVRVDNLSGQKVGNIQPDLAAALAPILDQNIAKLDATIPSHGDGRKIPVCIEFSVDNPTFNNRNDECRLVAILQEHGLKLRTTNVPEEHQQPTIQTARVAARKPQNQQMDKVFDEESNERFANLPEMPALPWQQGTDLLSHQEIGIRWMVHRETASDVSVPFTSQLNSPTPVRGGILADDMGLGKTIQAIGLILANRPKEDVKPKAATVAAPVYLMKSWLQRPTKTFVKSVGIKQLRQASHALGITPTNMTKPKLVNALHAMLWDGTLSPEQFHDAIKSPTSTTDEVTTDNPWAGCTLIVCPVSVISNWVQQIEQHVVPGTLRVAKYHGPERYSLLANVNEIDVLIASYNTLAYDFGAKEAAENGGKADGRSKPVKRAETTSIFDFVFHRVLLDEAHIIRSTTSRTFRACQWIRAAHRWCLTGTPVQNKLKDIRALFAFRSKRWVDKTFFVSPD